MISREVKHKSRLSCPEGNPRQGGASHDEKRSFFRRDSHTYKTTRTDGVKPVFPRARGDDPQFVNGQWPVLRLPDHTANAINAIAPLAILSAETLAKNKMHHPELTLQDYQALPDLGRPDLVIQDSDQTMVLVRRREDWYAVVVKATKRGEGIFVTSFRRTSEEDVARLRRRGVIAKKAVGGASP